MRFSSSVDCCQFMPFSNQPPHNFLHSRTSHLEQRGPLKVERKPTLKSGLLGPGMARRTYEAVTKLDQETVKEATSAFADALRI